KLLFDQDPLTSPIPVGDAVKVLRFSFYMDQGLSPGAEYPIEPKSNLGVPPVPALVYTGQGSVPPVGLVAGKAKVTGQNVLAVRPNSLQTIEFTAFTLSPLQGFSIGLKFDPSVVHVLSTDLSGTITEAVGAEYVAPIIDNTQGFMVLGVLLDSLPPFENQLI